MTLLKIKYNELLPSYVPLGSQSHRGRGLGLIYGIEPDLSALTVLRLRDRWWGLCYFWFYIFRLWVISSANTASPPMYVPKIHKFIQHSLMMTPKNLLRPIQEWIKNCISHFENWMALNKLKLNERKLNYLFCIKVFEGVLHWTHSLWEMTRYIRPIMRAILEWCLTLYIDVRKAYVSMLFPSQKYC